MPLSPGSSGFVGPVPRPLVPCTSSPRPLASLTSLETVPAPAPAEADQSSPPPPGLWTRRRVAVMLVSYALAMLGLLLSKGLFISGDRYVLILLVPALALGIGKQYIRDFVPFIVGILIYEELRGVAHLVHPIPYYEPWLWFDKFMFFGHVPNVLAQNLLWRGHLSWYDSVFALIQRAHFFVPPTLLFLIWLERRALFYRCALTLLIVSFAAALTFAIAPAAPPWKASDTHRIPTLARIGYIQAAKSPIKTGKSMIEAAEPRNDYAAVPSLHTAYSLLTLVFALAWRRRIGLAMIWYPLMMWWTIVYFGDHYVTDILFGIVYALASWFVAGKLLRGRLSALAGPFPPVLASARLKETPTQ